MQLHALIVADQQHCSLKWKETESDVQPETYVFKADNEPCRGFNPLEISAVIIEFTPNYRNSTRPDIRHSYSILYLSFITEI